MNPQQLKKLERLAKVLDNGDVELLTQLDQLETKTEQEIQAIKEVVMEALAVAKKTKKLKGDKGEKGERGKDGKDGKKGLDGKNGLPGVPGERGLDGKDGRDGVDGKDGKDGLDGKDGADGFIDEATVAYLEEEIKKLEKKHGGYGQVIRKLRAGRNVSVDDSNMEYPTITNTNPKITVSPDAPVDPIEDDIWIDTDASPSGGSSAWGGITGTLSDQTDLQNELDGKQERLQEGPFVDGDKTKLDSLSATVPMVILTKSSSVNQNVGGANGSETYWTWDGETIKDATFTHDNTTNSERVTVTETGWYEVTFIGGAQTTGSSRTTLQGIHRINGGTTSRAGSLRNYTRGASYGNITTGLIYTLQLTADDYIEVGTRVEDTDATYTINTNGGEISDDCHQLVIKKIR